MGRRGRPPHPDILTPREWEVLDLLRDGLTNEQIAVRLGVTRAGAKYHVSEILSKLGVATREEAAAWRPEPVPVAARRRWWAAIAWLRPLTAAKVAGAAVVVATVAALGVLAWGVWRTSGREEGPVVGGVTPAATASRPTPLVTPSPEPSIGGVEVIRAERWETVGRSVRCADVDTAALVPGIHVLDVASCELRQVTGDDFDLPTGWSADGARLAFIRWDASGPMEYADANGDVYVFDFASGTTVEVTSTTGIREEQALLSPDGSRVAFSTLALEQVVISGEHGVNEEVWAYGLALAAAAEGATVSTVATGLASFKLAWSPDGGTVAVATGYSDGRLFSVSADGLISDLASDAQDVWGPQWSPDGRLIAYNCHNPPRPPDYRDVCVVAPDGTGHRSLTVPLATHPLFLGGDLGGAAGPHWTSDGLVVISLGRGVLLVDPGSGELVRFIEGAPGNFLAADGTASGVGCAPSASLIIPCPTSLSYAVDLTTGVVEAIIETGCESFALPSAGGQSIAIFVPREGFCPP